ncbi:MAG: TonB-dependent receptor [Pseudomonadota bacterium]
MKLHTKLLGASALSLSLVAGAATAQAQESETRQLDTVVVTATKTETTLQDTPIAVTAVSAAKLEQQNVDDISEIAGFTPNLVFDTTSPVSGLSSGAVVFIRGVGQTDFQLTTDPGVGTYVDGVYTSRSAGGVLDVLDLERVEVLRGPQGTLFGRNAIGGAFNLISKRPSADFGGKAQIITGSRDRIDFQGSVNVPLSDTLRTRFSISTRNQDGYVRGLLDDRDLGDVNRDTFRGIVEWEPSDTFRATLTADSTKIREQNAASKLVGITVTPPGAPESTEFFFNHDTGQSDTRTVPAVPGNPSLAFLYNVIDSTLPGAQNGVLFDGAFITSDLDTTFATGPNGTNLDNWGTALTLDWDLGNTQLKSITAYRDSSGDFNRDADGSPLVVTHTENFDYDHEQFSQELQITGQHFDGAFNWVGGIYYFDETGNDFLNVTLPQAFGVVRNFTEVENESIAIYGQGTYRVSDALSFTAGVRYTEDDKTYSVPVDGGAIVNGLAGVFGPTGTITPFFPAGENNETFDDVSYKIGADYKLEDGTLLYASYSTGFKSGGFNTRYLVPVPQVVSFDPEQLETAEIGLKWQGFDNRVRSNFAAYFSDYSDIQLIVYESGAPLTRNAGSADIWGVEAEIAALLFDDLEASLSLGYTNAEYTEVAPLDPALPVAQQVTLDSELPNTPELTLAIALDYNTRLTDSMELILHGDYRHNSSVENDAINSVFLSQGATDVFNASIGVLVNDTWGLSIFGDNLGDERFITSGDSNFGIGFHEANFNRPREWGVKLTADF